MNKRAKDAGVYQYLIMVDGEGRIGDPDAAKRQASVENHHRWVEAAKTLGCAHIRVNAASDGSFEEQQKLAADGLRRLCEFADPHGINIIVENHGGLSSNGQWLAGVMKIVDHPRCGTLPDFGNFGDYDRYQGVTELMPFAKAVSAKSHDFDEQGNERDKDYRRLMQIVLDAGYRSWVGIEYEGRTLPEFEGIAATKRLLERVRDEMMKQQA
jgi:L-ribulose-5-phosphate 3-epimerase